MPKNRNKYGYERAARRRSTQGAHACTPRRDTCETLACVQLIFFRTWPGLPQIQKCVQGQFGGILPSRFERAACRVSRVVGVQTFVSLGVETISRFFGGEDLLNYYIIPGMFIPRTSNVFHCSLRPSYLFSHDTLRHNSGLPVQPQVSATASVTEIRQKYVYYCCSYVATVCVESLEYKWGQSG